MRNACKNPKVGKVLMGWDWGQILEDEIKNQIENWKEWGCYDEKPDEDTVRNEIYGSTALDSVWDDEMDYLTTAILRKKNPSGYWKAEVTGFGWRGTSAGKYFKETEGTKL